MNNESPWFNNLGHLAIVIDDLEKGKWFFGEVLQAPYFMFRGEQIMVELQSSILVAKLSKDAVDKTRQSAPPRRGRRRQNKKSRRAGWRRPTAWAGRRSR